MGRPPRDKEKRRGRENKHVDLAKTLTVFGEEKLDALLAESQNPLLLVLDGIQDPHNLGACLRVADAAGVDAILVPKNRAAPLTPTVRKIACGGAETVPFIRVVNIPRVIGKINDLGLLSIGTSDRASKSLYEIDLTGPTAIVVGSEADGIRRLTADRCGVLASIPMLGKVACLNASVATGVLLFEAVRQRIAGGER